MNVSKFTKTKTLIMKSLNKIRCIFLLLALLIFTNCEKDLYEEAVIQTSGRANVGNQTFTAKYIDGDEATGIGTVLQELIPGSIVGGRGLQNEAYTVQYDQVLKVIDNLGNKTYMFRVVHPEASSEKFFNMVLQQQTDGNIYVRMIEYKMTTSFAILYNSGQKQIKDFEGEYYNKLISHHLGTIDENAFHEWDEWGGNPGNGDGSPGPGNNGPVFLEQTTMVLRCLEALILVPKVVVRSLVVTLDRAGLATAMGVRPTSRHAIFLSATRPKSKMAVHVISNFF